MMASLTLPRLLFFCSLYYQLEGTLYEEKMDSRILWRSKTAFKSEKLTFCAKYGPFLDRRPDLRQDRGDVQPFTQNS